MRESGRGAVRWWSWVLAGLAVVVLGGGAVFLVVSREHRGSAGTKAVQMSTVDYRSVVVGPVSYLDLHHDYLHRVVVVTYMAPGCAACSAEIPQLLRTYGDFRNHGVQFIGVSLAASRAATRAMIAKLGIDYPVCLDSDGTAARQRFHVQDVPATLVYRKGRLLKRFGGGLTGSELSAYLATLTGTSGG